MRFLGGLPIRLERLGIALPDGQLERLERLCELMTADPLYPSVSKISEPEEIAEKHILDSLAPLAFDLPCWRGLRRAADLGTGGGFPAVPLAIRFPEAEVWAVDAKGKAVDFVARMKEGLGLANLRPRLGRAEDLGREKGVREGFDLVVCRALASVRVLLEYCLPLVRPGGHALLYKGPKIDTELAEAAKAMQVLGVRRDEISVHTLAPPALPFERGYVLIAKHRPTPEAYPRRNGVPSAKPL